MHGTEIRAVPAPSLERFTRDFHLSQRPALLRGLTADWPCRAAWAGKDGAPDFEQLLADLGGGGSSGGDGGDGDGLAISVVRCAPPCDGAGSGAGAEAGDGGYGEQERVDVPLGRFLRSWRDGTLRSLLPDDDGGGSADDDTAAAAAADLSPSIARAAARAAVYAKDFHLALHFPAALAADATGATGAPGAFYRQPALFADDWLNWWWAGRHLRGGGSGGGNGGGGSGGGRAPDDFRFLYMGECGSWTPLHHDVLRSGSWSANVCGRKLWLFFPPEQQRNLLDRHGRVTVPDARAAARATDSQPPVPALAVPAALGAAALAGLADAPDPVRFPGWSKAARHRQWLLQEPGEVVFVPSGWWHQVHNIGDVVSINHNWFNGCDLPGVWRFLLAELRAVEAELGHLRAPDDGTPPLVGAEWDEQCELVMRANCGLAMHEFRQLLLAKEKELLSEPPAPPPPGSGAAHTGGGAAGRALLRQVSLQHIAQVLGEMRDELGGEALAGGGTAAAPVSVHRHVEDAGGARPLGVANDDSIASISNA
jgi:hypothetical protein